MVTTEAEARKKRIEFLIKELAYELTRGLMEREIEADLHFSKLVPYNTSTAVIELHVYEGTCHFNSHHVPNVKLVVDNG